MFFFGVWTADVFAVTVSARKRTTGMTSEKATFLELKGFGVDVKHNGYYLPRKEGVAGTYGGLAISDKRVGSTKEHTTHIDPTFAPFFLFRVVSLGSMTRGGVVVRNELA